MQALQRQQQTHLINCCFYAATFSGPGTLPATASTMVAMFFCVFPNSGTNFTVLAIIPKVPQVAQTDHRFGKKTNLCRRQYYQITDNMHKHHLETKTSSILGSRHGHHNSRATQQKADIRLQRPLQLPNFLHHNYLQ